MCEVYYVCVCACAGRKSLGEEKQNAVYIFGVKLRKRDEILFKSSNTIRARSQYSICPFVWHLLFGVRRCAAPLLPLHLSSEAVIHGICYLFGLLTQTYTAPSIRRRQRNIYIPQKKVSVIPIPLCFDLVLFSFNFFFFNFSLEPVYKLFFGSFACLRRRIDECLSLTFELFFFLFTVTISWVFNIFFLLVAASLCAFYSPFYSTAALFNGSAEYFFFRHAHNMRLRSILIVRSSIFSSYFDYVSVSTRRSR